MTGSHCSSPSSLIRWSRFTSSSPPRTFTDASLCCERTYSSSLSSTLSGETASNRSSAAPKRSPKARHSQRGTIGCEVTQTSSFARPLHSSVERDRRRSEARPANERKRVGRAPIAIHARVLPPDRERSGVADAVERTEQRLEVDVTVSGRDEVPTALGLAEVQVSAEDALPPVERLARVLDVHVVDPVGELLYERGGVQELVREVARVEVDPELRPATDRGERLAGRDEVVGDLRRVHLEAEPDAFMLEHVHDRAPALGEARVTALHDVEVVRRKQVEQVPDARAGEAVHLLD